MTIDRASVEEGARLADEVLRAKTIGIPISAWAKARAAYFRHANPEHYAELAHELQRLWRVEEAARNLGPAVDYGGIEEAAGWAELDAALANSPAEGDG